ncbi:MAG TPA: hypothetical protein VMC85_09965 [Desulfomonilaceae bacterium]|nr:hypothetical protein [Desulfomonilaceae bacterium]
MKYVTFAAIVLIIWLLVDLIIIKRGSSGKSILSRDRWLHLGSSIHLLVGIVAALIILIYVLRVLLRALAGR